MTDLFLPMTKVPEKELTGWLNSGITVVMMACRLDADGGDAQAVAVAGR